MALFGLFRRAEVEAEPQILADTGADLVTSAVQRGLREGRAETRATTAEINRARDRVAAVRRVTDMPEALAKVLEDVGRHPREERFQQLAARVLERFQDPRALAVWRGIDERFPASREAYLRVLRWTIRIDGFDAGRELHDRRFEQEPTDPVRLLVFARSLLELKDFEEAERVFSELVEMKETPDTVLAELARIYLTLGQPMRAREIAALGQERYGATRRIAEVSERVERDIAALQNLASVGDGGTSHLPNRVIERVFEIAREQRGDVGAREHRDFLGPVVLINGSLGSGGAERQLTNTAVRLQEAIDAGRPIGGRDVIGPVHVLCRSLHSRAGADFFAPQFEEAGLIVHEYAEMPEFVGRPRLSCVREVIEFFDHIPPQMREGLVCTADILRHAAPDVVHIWQDGSVLATGLAALFAGVPRIVLGVRTLPPTDRAERNKPEYEAVYRSLLAAPGVVMVANSHAAARRYESWLSLPTGTVRVIPNGLAALPTEGDEATLEMARAFDARTSPDWFTIGSVMRLDDNKRPLPWLDAAAALVARRPDVRFVVVGDGPLRQKAIRHAEDLGIADRVLFTGRSSHVGHWLTRMDAFLLLSRHEGLPNVLIEAQFAGIPVVTTPAGGAAETLEIGVSGTLLKSVDDVDPEVVADALLTWERRGAERTELAERIRERALERFSIERMLELTMDAYLD
jgi:pentatricopeptide repeat protein